MRATCNQMQFYTSSKTDYEKYLAVLIFFNKNAIYLRYYQSLYINNRRPNPMEFSFHPIDALNDSISLPLSTTSSTAWFTSLFPRSAKVLALVELVFARFVGKFHFARLLFGIQFLHLLV